VNLTSNENSSKGGAYIKEAAWKIVLVCIESFGELKDSMQTKIYAIA